MTLFEQPKILDIQHIHFQNGQLAVSLSHAFSNQDVQSKIDASELLSFFKKNGVQAVTLRSLEGSKTSFICKINTKTIALMTKSSIKKTRYLFSVDSLELKVNDRVVPQDFVIQFLGKMDHIAELVRSEKVMIDGE